jgi:membrane fusion protein, heavy metal efflux system
MNKSIYFFPIITAALFLSSCKSNENKIAVDPKPPIISDSTMQLLQIDSVQMRPVDEEVKLSGEVSFDENKVVKVYPFSSGQVLETNVSTGDYVHAGQVLATIKSADIAGNYSDLAVAGNDVAIAKRSMENAEHLYKNGISSEKDFIEAKENYNKSVANANKIKQQIQINGGGKTSANGTYIVTAPRNGFVVEKMINPGNFIRNDNNSHLFTIGDISDVWIWANVYETDVAKVKSGYGARVTTLAYPDTVFIGKVDKVNQVLDPITKVMKVKIVLQNQTGLLKPEMFANVFITHQDGKKQLAVPASAVISENGKNYVVVYNNRNDVKVQEVSVTKSTATYSFISSGVNERDKIITQNQILVYRKLMEK